MNRALQGEVFYAAAFWISVATNVKMLTQGTTDFPKCPVLSIHAWTYTHK